MYCCCHRILEGFAAASCVRGGARVIDVMLSAGSRWNQELVLSITLSSCDPYKHPHYLPGTSFVLFHFHLTTFEPSFLISL